MYQLILKNGQDTMFTYTESSIHSILNDIWADHSIFQVSIFTCNSVRRVCVLNVFEGHIFIGSGCNAKEYKQCIQFLSDVYPYRLDLIHEK